MLKRFCARLDSASQQRLAFFAAGLSFGINGLIFSIFFPKSQQFDKYIRAAADYLAAQLPAERISDFSPLTFWIHVAATALTGSSAGCLLVLQLVASAATAALFFLLLRRFLESNCWSFAGVLLFLASAPVWTYALILEPETLLLVCVVAFLYFSKTREIRDIFLSGLFFGLSLLIRPTLLPLLLLMPLWLRWNGAGRKALQIFLLPPLAALLLLTLQNIVFQQRLTPTVMNPGFVFFEGNNPLSTGQSAVYPPLIQEMKVDLPGAPDSPHLTYRRIAALDLGRPVDTAAANRYWSDRAWSYIRNEPLAWLRLLATKAFFLLHSERRYDIQVAYEFNQTLAAYGLAGLPFSLISLFALTGAALMWRERQRLFLFYAVALVQMAVMLATYVSDRQRLLLLPVFLLFALLGVRRLWALPLLRRTLLPATLAAALLLVFPTGIMRDSRHIWQGYAASDRDWLEALRLREAGRLSEAADAATRSYAAAPWLRDYSRPAFLSFGQGFAAAALNRLPAGKTDCSDQLDRALLLMDAGRLPEAGRLLEQISKDGCRFDRVSLQSSQPDYFRARIAMKQNDPGTARRFYAAALAVAPSEPFVLADLAALGDAAAYARLVETFGETHADFMTGLAGVDLRQPSAVAPLRRIVQTLPELRRSRIYLAAAESLAGDDATAAMQFRQATADRIDPVLLEDEIMHLFRQRTLALPSGAPYGDLAQVSLFYGHYREALAALDRANLSDGEAGRLRAQIQRISAADSR